MKYFVTGATGYIGAHLVKYLTNNGHMVHALVRKIENARKVIGPDVKLYEGDLLSPSTIDIAMRGCDYVFHLAAFAKVWTNNPANYFDQNVLGTSNILNAAIRNGVSRCVVTSTAGVFGPSKNGEMITEKSSRGFDFFNEYECSKCLSESRIKDYVIEGLDVVIVSPTRVYGPYLHGDPKSITLLVEKFVKRNWRFIPGNGKKSGNYIFINDVVLGHIAAMERGKKGSTYILGGLNHNYLEFFETLMRVTGKERIMIKLPYAIQLLFAKWQLIKGWFGVELIMTPKWISKGNYDWNVSPQRAVDELSLPITPLEQGLKETVCWINSRKPV